MYPRSSKPLRSSRMRATRVGHVQSTALAVLLCLDRVLDGVASGIVEVRLGEVLRILDAVALLDDADQPRAPLPARVTRARSRAARS
jgi:hypothetical protein